MLHIINVVALGRHYILFAHSYQGGQILKYNTDIADPWKLET